MRDWVDTQLEYLARLLAHEAPLPGLPCSMCRQPNSIYRCRDCQGNPHYCDRCLRTQHSWNPCHRIEVWTGTFFQRTSLRKIGLCLYLGHHGNPCPLYGNPASQSFTPPFTVPPENTPRGDDPDMDGDRLPNYPADEDAINQEVFAKMTGMVDLDNLEPLKGTDNDDNPWLTVVHTTGIHYLRAKFCRCPNSPIRRFQLLDAGLYPATQRRRKIVFTFQVLDDFYIENLECKTPALNYYSKLRRLTSTLFPHLVLVGTPLTNNKSWYD